MREIITDDDMHASLQSVPSCASTHSNSVWCRNTEASGSSSDGSPSDAGAAAGTFNLDACFKSGEGK